MISWIQLGTIGRDYGPFVLVLALLVFLVWALWRIFPAVSSVVSVINLLKKLPAWMTGQDESNERKEVTLGEIQDSIKKTEVAITQTASALSTHVASGTTQIEKLDNHLAQAEASASEWIAIKAGFWDMQAKMNLLLQTTAKIDVAQEAVIHEVKHNGGSSLKDATARAESAVIRTEDRLAAIEALLIAKLGDHRA